MKKWSRFVIYFVLMCVNAFLGIVHFHEGNVDAALGWGSAAIYAFVVLTYELEEA